MTQIGIPFRSLQKRVCLHDMTELMAQAVILQSFTEQMTLPALHLQTQTLTCILPLSMLKDSADVHLQSA